MLEFGALSVSLARRTQVDFLVDHDTANYHGSTKDGLSLAVSDYGLAFRFELKPDIHCNMLAAIVGSGNRAAVSVGLSNIEGYRGARDGEAVFF